MKINFKSKYLFFVIFLFVALISVGFSMWNIASSTGSVNGEINTEEVDSFSDYIELGNIKSFKYCALGDTMGFVNYDETISSNTELSDDGRIEIPFTIMHDGPFTVIIEISSTTSLPIFTPSSFNTNNTLGLNASTSNEPDYISSTVTVNFSDVSASQEGSIFLNFTIVNDTDGSLKRLISSSGMGFSLTFRVSEN